jgi:hypothetical protein
MTVSLPAAVFTLVWVPRMAFGLRACPPGEPISELGVR